MSQSGHPVAKLRPQQRRSSDPVTLLNRWRRLPRVDPDKMRRDIGQIIDPYI